MSKTAIKRPARVSTMSCASFPARTTIGVAALPLGASVEIDLVVKA